MFASGPDCHVFWCVFLVGIPIKSWTLLYMIGCLDKGTLDTGTALAFKKKEGACHTTGPHRH